MDKIYQFFKSLSPYKDMIGLALLLIGVFIVVILIIASFQKLKKVRAEQLEQQKADNLKNVDYTTVSGAKKSSILRQIVAPDALDPGPNGYLIINDGGRDVYVRNFTISSLPSTAVFATTFAQLLDFPRCTSSIFVDPIPEGQMISKLDHQITILTSERGSTGDPNRYRKLTAQIDDVNSSARQVENGENKFFQVKFVFSLYADDLRSLNKMTSEFVAKATGKNISMTNCFAAQAEAYARNAPFDGMQKVTSALIKSDGLQQFRLDKYSLSALYNYTQSAYSHKNGIPLGRDLLTAAPIMFDIYAPSHDGYTLVIAGKTRSGKSATIKMMACRQLLQGYHFVAVDSQARKGLSEGEYAGLASLCGGINFQISSRSEEVMNILEVSETTRTRPDDNGKLHEMRTLELADKISMVANVIKAMVGASKQGSDFKMDKFLHRVIVDNLQALYKSFGIIDGDPDSLYEKSDNIDSFGVSSGRKQKPLPTITDFYKQILISRRDNTSPNYADAYDVLVTSLVDYVKELYYSEKTCWFFSREEFENLPFVEGAPGREYINDMHQKEAVIEVHGIRSYYDGQSSVHISKDVAFTNIDISQLPDNEKNLARQIAIDFINENFIKRNSEDIGNADKLECIFDEAHENFSNDYARATLDGVVRTARKRNVAVILSTQTLAEFDRYPETQAILTQTAVKFIFKQDYKHKDYLINVIGLTEAQTDFILNNLGGDPDNEEDSGRHRGEMCIMDNKQVAFCKVDYLKSTESLPVETDAEGIKEVFKSGQGQGQGQGTLQVQEGAA